MGKEYGALTLMKWLKRSLPLVVVSSTVLCSGGQSWDPPAITVHPSHEKAVHDPAYLAKMLVWGHELFVTKFNILDGGGRPGATGDSKPTVRPVDHNLGFTRISGPDANSCFGCHNEPRAGGSGEFDSNVFVGAQFSDPPILSSAAAGTSDRNTPSIFGTGAIEMLAREITSELLAERATAVRSAAQRAHSVSMPLKSKGISYGMITARPDGTVDETGIEGIDADLVVKPFGWKGVVISLREFTINALNQHHGMEAIERFGWERTGRRDFDDDGVEVEFTVGQTTALTLFQASLPAPGRTFGTTEREQQQIQRGESLFAKIGCSRCHVPQLTLNERDYAEPNPYNRPGNLLPSDGLGTIRIHLRAAPRTGLTVDSSGKLVVHAFSDLKRHRICDDTDPFLCNERLRQDNVPTDDFITPRLWDLRTSAPYGHRGDCTTLSEIIRHHAGEATVEGTAFMGLTDNEKRELIAFLRSLGSER